MSEPARRNPRGGVSDGCERLRAATTELSPPHRGRGVPIRVTGPGSGDGLPKGERWTANSTGWLVGRTLTDLEHLGHGSWRFGFGPEAEVRVECPWRIVRDGGIRLSSEDNGHRYGLPQPVDAEADCRTAIGGSVVTAVAARDETRDLVIWFGGGARLEVVPLSSGYESWQAGGPGRSLVVAQGGGSLAVWGPLDEPTAPAGDC